MEILFFLAGIAAVILPSFFPIMLAMCGLFLNYSHRFVLILVVGGLWGLSHQFSQRPNASIDVSSPLRLKGVVASLPKRSPSKTQFEFLTETPDLGRINLSCYQDCPNFELGETWEIRARLKTPQSYRNPGSFDYAMFLSSKHVVWTGTILKQGLRLLENRALPFQVIWLKWRVHLSNRFNNLGSDDVSRGIVEALTLGLVHHLPQETWGLFRRTGTTHLMVISGAHIGLVAGLVFKSIHLIWRYIGRLSAFIPAMRVARYVAVCVGFGYAFLAGFGIPARRAVWSFSALSLRYCLSMYFTPGQAWRMALWFVLLLEPHAVLLPGFYLSFIAVAILIFVSQCVQGGWIKTTLMLQAACLFGLMPFTLYWFEYASLSGFFANLIAIPWVSFILIPLGLLNLLHPWNCLLSIEQTSVAWLLAYLSWIDRFSWINLTHVFQGVFSPFLMFFSSVIWILVPLKPLRLIVLLLWVSAWMPARSFMRTNEAEIDVLDVGQGLSVVIKTRHHTLLYDTGMKFYKGSDIGEWVIAPYFRKRGFDLLDKVIISHPDLDHRGGLHTLQRLFTIRELVVDNPLRYRELSRDCHQMRPWVWDGIKFEFLPIQNVFLGTNNRSCVLKVSRGHAAMLLTGDIEYPAERYLVEQYSAQLKSTVLLVPHHGSKTSSSLSFLEHVSPLWAVVSYGAYNRYHFPHPSAMARYFEKKIPVYSTAEYGLLKIKLSDSVELKRSSWPYLFFMMG